MHTSLMFTTSLVLALASSAAAQDASCQDSSDTTTCQKASEASANASVKASPVAATPVALATMDDDEIAKLLKEVRAALAEVESAAQEATELEAGALPAARSALGYASTADERGYLGVSMQIGDGAMTIEEVLEGSGAAAAGLRAGDRILTIAGQSAEDAEALMAHLGELEAGDTVKITYERDGKQRKAKVELSTLAAIQPERDGGQRELEKVEASEGGIEWIEIGDDDVTEIVEVASEQEHEPRVFTLQGGDRRVHVVGADDLGLEGLEGLVELEGIGVDLEGLEGLMELHGGQFKLEGLEALEVLKGMHLDLEGLENLEGLPGNMRIMINGEDMDLSELENLGGLFEVHVEADDEHSGQHKIEIHGAHGDDNDIRQRVIRRMGGQDGRRIIQFGKQAPVVVELQADPEIKADVKFGYAIAVTGEDGEPQIIEIEGLPDGDFMKDFKLPKGIQVKGGNVIHLRHDDDDDDSPSHGFFFSDDDDNIRFGQSGQVIIKTQSDGSEPQIQEFTFGGEDGGMPEKLRELLKSHGGMGQGIFLHKGGDHDFNVDIEEIVGGKGGNVRILRSHGGGDEDVLFFTDDDHELPKGARNITRNRVRFAPGGGGGVWVMDDDDGDSDSHGNVHFFGAQGHELPEGVREMMKNRLRFSSDGGELSFTVHDDDDHEHAGHDDDDHGHDGHDGDDSEVHVFEVDGGNWTGNIERRVNGEEMGRRIRERVQQGMRRMQMREAREDRGRDNVRGLEHEIEALKDRIRDLERAIERLGRRR